MLSLELYETVFQPRSQGTGVEEAWAEVVDVFEAVVIPVDDVATEVADFMAAYGVASYDAVHAATAVVTGPGAIVTLDVGFSAIPQTALRLFVDGSRVSRCRKIRSR